MLTCIIDNDKNLYLILIWRLFMQKKLISALIPAYNEEECLYELYKRVSSVLLKLENYDYEILIVNDGSKDKTLEIMQELHSKDNHFQYINLARNYGKKKLR